MRKLFFFFFLIPFIGFSQVKKYPVFDECKGETLELVKDCFFKMTKETFYNKFQEPPIIQNESFKGIINATFIVTNTGEFKLIYVNSPYKELKEEVDRVFKSFPRIQPAQYNNHNIEMQFVFPLVFPLEDDPEPVIIDSYEPQKEDLNEVVKKQSFKDVEFPIHTSQLNIPFTHQRYVDYEYAMHKKGKHTASKPYLFNDVNQLINLDSTKTQFLKPEVQTWVGRKLWNEHLLSVQEEDYWFTMDFLLDLQFGKDDSDVSFTYNNSRILRVNGGFGKNFSFSATIYESQARFADYINQYIENPSLNFRPAFSEGLVPGRGKAKRFKEDAFDYPVAEGYLSYTPNKFLQFQFGHGKNFIGDGYRSFFLSDVSSPSLYLKGKVNFWKFEYTNLWIWGRDLRFPAVVDNEHARKYIALHYLSINITERFNLGLFEAAISTGENGMDAAFFNPLIFYRSVEFNRGEDSGNAMVGLSARYKASDQISLYSQLVIDEFSVGNLTNLGDWRNKFALQLGAKYFDAFEVEDLFLQGEFNYARPYTFAHRNATLNYGNYNQPLGHLWGANFWELVGIARYKKDRWSGSAKLVIGKKGFDFADEAVSYGGNIFQSYDIRLGDTGNSLAQGNSATVFNLDLQGNYLLNPSNNLSLFAGFSYRNLSIDTNTNGFSNGSNIWFRAGIRADLFNWYFDF
ncbi:gliding motility protein RemB [Pseudotenacibaculum haliotis]|uniref:Gliding motility protein RemB n=1 Tax=Pseudotenacibaculum haliotis TaxID=1862138 RepID=A0ABW5LS32_9FLAO